MNAHDRWERTIARFGAGQIELKVLVVRVGILNTLFHDDGIGHLRGRLSPEAGSHCQHDQQSGQ
jgi:hypothetical protein